MNRIPDATPIVLSTQERAELDGLARSTKTEHRLRQRARIVLLAADGMASRAIGRAVGCTTGTASKWRVRYAEKRLLGLDETGNRGAEPKYTAATNKRILALLDQPPPPGHVRWSGPLLAAVLGDVDVQYVWRFLQAQKIDLAGRKSWCESHDPDFAAKAADVVGLYMAPPENAIVICVDEKPSIQALERAQGYLKLPNGRALRGQSHDYKRNGTTTLFAAFEVATGGRTVAIEYRWGEGRAERYAEIAAEFVRLKVDVILAGGTEAAIAAKQATSVIPIVFPTAGDPVGSRLVASLARPGGNVTGLSNLGSDLAAKRLGLLREVFPGLRRLAVTAS
jgi:transposase